jgi:transketolase
LRIGKTGEPLVHTNAPELVIGKGYTLQEGKDVCLISTGNMLPTTMQVATLLKEHNLTASVVSMHTVKPLDTQLLNSLSLSFPLLVSIEEHSLIAGLGSSIAEWMIDNNKQTTQLLRFGTKDIFSHPIGSQSFLRKAHSLTPEAISARILQTLTGENHVYRSCYSR